MIGKGQESPARDGDERRGSGAPAARTGTAPDALDLFADLSTAESAAEEVVDLLLQEGGRQLYQGYIERKSFAFASDAILNVLASELQMCYVRYDKGEPRPTTSGTVSGAMLSADPAGVSSDLGGAAGPGAASDACAISEVWSIEQEPRPCQIDTWARACIPIRKKLIRPKAAIQEEYARKAKRPTTSSKPTKLCITTSGPNSRSPSRSRGRTWDGSGPEEACPPTSTRAQMIPLELATDQDEEEAMLRDMKDREARRRREEEQHLLRKAADEAEEAARLAQVKDQMKNKPYTYDSNGNIIWVQPLQTEKLPSSNPAPHYALRSKEAAHHGADAGGERRPGGGAGSANRGGSGGLGKRRTKASTGKKKDPEFSDSFKKFASQQPAMMESVVLSAGVVLSERGHTKSGPREENKKDAQPMSRRDYEDLVSAGGTGHGAAGYPGGRDAAGVRAATPQGVTSAVGQDLAEVSRSRPPSAGPAGGDTDSASRGIAAGEQREKEMHTFRVVRHNSELGTNMVPRPPATPRPEQPAPPPMVRRVDMKRYALGYSFSSRERVPTGTGSRFPGCAAPPVLGATMGHGLLPQGQKYEEYYFPDAPGSDLDGPEGQEASSAVASVIGGSPQGEPQGKIVNKNPELVKRLFDR